MRLRMATKACTVVCDGSTELLYSWLHTSARPHAMSWRSASTARYRTATGSRGHRRTSMAEDALADTGRPGLAVSSLARRTRRRVFGFGFPGREPNLGIGEQQREVDIQLLCCDSCIQLYMYVI